MKLFERRDRLARQCKRFRTAKGRLAHLWHADHGVLCGQLGADHEAEPSLEDCRLCKTRLAELSGKGGAAS